MMLKHPAETTMQRVTITLDDDLMADLDRIIDVCGEIRDEVGMA